VTPTGAIVCWGGNTYHQRDVPAGTFTQVVAGGEFSCGLKTDQSAVCWGSNANKQTEVTAATQTASGEWKLTTSRGEITCEHVVCATGNYARETGRMFGLNLPAIPVEHQYIVYDESPELKQYNQEQLAANGSVGGGAQTTTGTTGTTSPPTPTTTQPQPTQPQPATTTTPHS
jgi:hypothetical protein